MFVGITQQLCRDVDRIIYKMSRKELDALGECPLPLLTEQDVEQQIWGEHLPLRSMIPGAWKGSLTECGCTMEITPSSGPTTRKQVTIKFAIGVATPPGFSRYTNVVPVDDVPALGATKTWLTNQLDTELRWKLVESQVKSFLTNCKSLNEALKLYPDLAMYIPEEYIARVNEKKDATPKEASRAAEVLKSIDTDALRAAAVISRMS